MTNAFEELGFEPRPWLDPQKIKDRYHSLAASIHPNQLNGDGESLARLNDARRILESNNKRLLHLMTMTFPEFFPTKKSDPNWEMFSHVGSLSKRTRELAKKRESASSALSRAVITNEFAKTRKELEALELKVSTAALAIEDRIKATDSTWPDVAPSILWQLAEEWTFCNRWNTSLREARTVLDGG